ncbi:MAG TPA: 3-deoxy-7-phosphoheptulonate synthase [Gemmatimonadales bacterium]|nr:3-deoxy-7-phosphoheptulonate synthase [Gemmatimonadales bacterium]
MIIVLRPHVTDDEVARVVDQVRQLGLTPHVSRGVTRTIIGCIGDEDRLREMPLLSMPAVDTILPIEKPYKLAAREFTARETHVRLGGTLIGDGAVHVIAGPCSVEGQPMLLETATAVKAAGAVALRGGAFKPRTSPYSFRGLGAAALDMMVEVRAATGLPVVTEVLDTRHVALVAARADCLQVGARNMQNFALLTEVGDAGKPVLLKRGLSATLEDFLLAAEYILARGNPNVILCERGIRTFERALRNTLDIGAVPYLKQETHLPVLVDPSHAAGRRDLVPALALAAVAAGADGLLIEVHPDPDHARSDGDQSLDLVGFGHLMQRVGDVAAALGRPGAGVGTSTGAVPALATQSA